MASHRNMYELLIKGLPRAKLEEMLGRDVRPWMMSRRELEDRLIAQDSPERREELAGYVTSLLVASL